MQVKAFAKKCWENVKETTTQLKSRKHPRATYGSLAQQQNQAPPDGLHLTPHQFCISVQQNGCHTKLKKMQMNQILKKLKTDKGLRFLTWESCKNMGGLTVFV